MNGVSAAIAPDVLGRVAALDDALELLGGELEAAANPHRVALRSLGISASGWTRKAYDPVSFDIWTRLLGRDADDFESRHHVAIMHHARAVDLEQGDQPRESNADWEAALGHWIALWQNDAFWDALSATVCPDGRRSAVDGLRARFPALLLQLHFDVAVDPDTPHHRAKYHIALALGSSLPDAAKTDVRRATYERLAQAIPDAVWQGSTLDEAVLNEGVRVITRYLDLDPTGLAALGDALRLQVRLIRLHANELAAIGDADPAQRDRLVDRLKQAAETWNAYFRCLLDRAPLLEDDVRRDLCLWYRFTGDLYCALERHAEAIPYYEDGRAAGHDDDPESLRCRREIPETHAVLARRMVERKDVYALSYAKQVHRRDDLTVYACQQLGNAFLGRDEFDLAEDVCQRGLSLDIAADGNANLEREELARERVRELLGMVRTARALKQAREIYDRVRALMQEEHYRESVPLLTECVALNPSDDAYYFMRGRCHMELFDIDAARADLEAYRRTMSSSEKDREFEVWLDREIDAREMLLRRFGRTSVELRREAVSHQQNGDPARAIERLRDALSHCEPDGRAELMAELSASLCSWAIDQANRTTEDGSLDPSSKLTRYLWCHELLEEACRLDAGSEHARNSLAALDNEMSTTRARIRFVERVGPEAAALRDLARELETEGHFDEASQRLSEAIDRCRPEGIGEIRSALADLLATWAARSVNTVREDGSRSLRDQIAVCREALARLEKARTIDPQAARPRENLDALRGVLAATLRSAAADAHRHERYQAADELLSEASGLSDSTARTAIMAERSVVLADWAIDGANAATSDQTMTPPAKLARYATLRARLEEARRLDSTNSRAANSMKALDQLMTGARAAVREFERIGTEAASLREDARRRAGEGKFDEARSLFERALACCQPGASAELRQDLTNVLRSGAAAAYKKDQYQTADSLLRDALTRCAAADRQAISRELSIVLSNWAVHDVNDVLNG